MTASAPQVSLPVAAWPPPAKGSATLSGRPSGAPRSSADSEPLFGTVLALAGQRQSMAAPGRASGTLSPRASQRRQRNEDAAAPALATLPPSGPSEPPVAPLQPSPPAVDVATARESALWHARAATSNASSVPLPSAGRAVAPIPSPARSTSGTTGDAGAPVVEAPLEETGEPWRRQRSGAEVQAPEAAGGAPRTDPAASPAPAPEPGLVDGDGLFTAARADFRASPFPASGELAFAGWLEVAPSLGGNAVSAPEALASPLAGPARQGAPETVPAEQSGRNAGRAAAAADIGPIEDHPVANPPGAGKAAAISASEDDGAANHELLSDGSPDQAGDVSRRKTGGSAGRDESIANDGSGQPAAEFRAADAISSGSPSAALETGGAPVGEAGGAAADRRTPAPLAIPEPAPAPRTPARDITLRLSDGDQRVDVRLVERQGDVRVEVRTPDAGLAGDLRRDLPSLAARLEQSGIRAETWRGDSEGRRFSGSDSPAAEQDANASQGRRHGREGRDDQPGRPREAEEQIDPKGKRKEFEWYMSSHR